MKVRSVIGLCCIFLCVGVLYYACTQRWIIVQLPTCSVDVGAVTVTEPSGKNPVSILFWSQGVWKKEIATIIGTDDKAQNIAYVVKAWLTVVEQAGNLSKNIKLETAMLSGSANDLFLSFSRTIFGAQQSIFEKWMLVEGLLKTVRTFDSSIARVRLLVHHQPLQDAHLDFSQPWQSHGFLAMQ